MTKEELLTYYRANKNLNNEITLKGKVTGLEYKFRHYQEYFTGKDYWVHLQNGLLFDTIGVLEKYVLPKHYTDEEHEKLLKSLKVGDIIVVKYCDDIKLYSKKVDDDCFIACDNACHISKGVLDKVFIYKIKDIIKSTRSNEIKKVTEWKIEKSL